MRVVEHRRTLHQIPELDFQLPKTLSYIRSVLEGLPCQLHSPIPGSICAYFDCGKAETVAFRADMDALPVEECTALPFASRHSGVMHACGHDGHTAIALALAEEVAQCQGDLPRNVLFIFQPAEETSGGALPLCEAGILERFHVCRIFGLHLWPNLPAGQVYTRPGALMALSSEVTVTVTGKSVHLSRAAQGRDALTAGMDYLQRAYAMVRALPEDEPCVLRFGKMVSGTVRNAISGKTVLEGSLRTYRLETFHACQDRLREIGQAVFDESGCQVETHFSDGYPPVWNHEGLYETLCAQLGDEAPALLDAPSLAAEDFSVYQQRVPGVFFFLGTGATPELHASNFTFDDASILPAGVAFMKRLALLP